MQVPALLHLSFENRTLTSMAIVGLGFRVSQTLGFQLAATSPYIIPSSAANTQTRKSKPLAALHPCAGRALLWRVTSASGSPYPDCRIASLYPCFRWFER